MCGRVLPVACLHVDGPRERGRGEVQDGNVDTVDVSDTHPIGVRSGKSLRR
jgi:hypothetical protein